MLETPSPYVLASIMLAANNTGDSKLAAAAYETLKAGAKAEGDMVYWDQLTNTPFHSWGHPGRVEATATVVGALAAARGEPALIDKGLLFLLKSKDAYGVWHSTQATVRVLDALSGLITEHREGAGAADVLVNGVKVTAVRFGEASGQNKVMLLDISKFLVPGGNRVEVIATKRMPWALVHLTENHYVPWDPSAPDLVSGPLRFSVLFDKVESPIGETIHARVTAERTESRGSGMMLGEIGLPPGADVDRASLDRAMAIPGAALTRYDILPDRVIVYLWPHAADSTFEFTFRLRYGIEARTPASQLYDYYNPDARVIVPPTRFVAR
jgi:hypothetical protein